MSYNVLSKEGLIAWLERQPAETKYSYVDVEDCLAAEYLHAHGLHYCCPRNARPNGNFSEQLEYVGLKARAVGTYGEALKVARTLP